MQIANRNPETLPACQTANTANKIASVNLATAFAASVEKRPGKIALFWGESEFTYGAVFAQSRAVAAELAGKFGVKPDDRVALWLKNRPEFIPAIFGILGAGAVLVPINNFLKPDEVNYILRDGGIDVLITEDELAVHTPALLAARPQLKIFKVEDFSASPSPISHLPSPPTRSESDLAVIIYTSGTMGRPKGAMLSHGNVLHNVESCRLVLETVDQDRMAVLLPLFHSYMLTVGVFLPLLVGGTMVLVKSLNQPRQVLQELCARQTTILPAIPPFYRALAGSPTPVKLPFRLCISGSAPLPVQVLKDFAGDLIQLYFHHACAFTQLLWHATYEMSNACRRVKNVDLIHAFQSEMKQAFPDGTDDVEVGVVGIQCGGLQAFQLALFDLLGERIFSALHYLAVAEADIVRKQILLILVRQSVRALQPPHCVRPRAWRQRPDRSCPD